VYVVAADSLMANFDAVDLTILFQVPTGKTVADPLVADGVHFVVVDLILTNVGAVGPTICYHGLGGHPDRLAAGGSPPANVAAVDLGIF
jgi:hypothetical protein